MCNGSGGGEAATRSREGRDSRVRAWTESGDTEQCFDRRKRERKRGRSKLEEEAERNGTERLQQGEKTKGFVTSATMRASQLQGCESQGMVGRDGQCLPHLRRPTDAVIKALEAAESCCWGKSMLCRIFTRAILRWKCLLNWTEERLNL